MSVEAIANASANVLADGDALGDANSAVAASADATAIGVLLGAGSDSVWSIGQLSVTATPSAQAYLQSSEGGGICIWFFVTICFGEGDSHATADVDFSATAAGILAGDGDNTITNDGSIVVTAAPEISIDFRRPEDGQYAAIARGETRTITINSSSTAVGIETGSGNDTIINNGDILVEAYDLISSCEEETGDCGVSVDDQSVLTSIGVQTGDGDDAVTNNGTIAAYTVTDGVATSTIAIDLGAGNDTLTLGDGSSTFGTIVLGEDDDRLILMGTPLEMDDGNAVFSLPGGVGDDRLLLVGDGSFTGQLIEFEHATKYDPGTFWLPGIATLSTLTIDGGTLALGSSYDFSPDGAFFTFFDAEGDHGLFDIDGSSVLNGAMTVERRGGTYISDDSRYTLIATTDGVSNAFADITLPESRPLLSFDLEQTASTVDLIVNVESFAFTASNKLHRLVAGNLNSVAESATGEFDTRIGTLQNMRDGFDLAYASLAPDAYQALTANTISTTHETTQLLRNHLSDARAFGRGEKPAAAAYEPVALLYDGTNFQTARVDMLSVAPSLHLDEQEAFDLDPGHASNWLTWMGAYSGTGDYKEVEGYTQYDHDTAGFAVGLDRALGNNWIMGLTVGFNDSDLKMQEAAANSQIESWSGTLYATKYSDQAFFEGGLYFANQTVSASRLMTIGTQDFTVTSEHDGETWMAFLSSGYRFDFETWDIEPYGSLFYFDISEDPFEETGAGSINQVFSEKSTTAVFGEIGARLRRLHETDQGLLDWHATVAYNHNFDVDDNLIGYGYAGEPDTEFTIPDRSITTGSAVFSAGVAYIRGRSTLGIDYRGQYNDDYTNHIVGARFGYEF